MSDVRVEVGQRWKTGTKITFVIERIVGDDVHILQNDGRTGRLSLSLTWSCFTLLSSPPPDPAPVRSAAVEDAEMFDRALCKSTTIVHGGELAASAPSAQQCPDCGGASAPGTQAHAFTCPRVTLSAQQPAPKVPAPPTGSVPRAPDCRAQAREHLALSRWRSMHPDQPDGPGAGMLAVKMWSPWS